MEWVELILTNIPVIVGLVLLIINLIKYVKKAALERNWPALIGLVQKLMEEAEVKFTDGATRKEWVIAMVQTSSEYINYPVDIQMLSEMIDSFCDMTKVVNYNEPAEVAETEPDPKEDTKATAAA